MIKISEKVEQKEKKEVEEEPEEKKPDSQGLVDRGIETAERIERANKKHEELLQRQEALAVTNALGGKSDAGEGEVKPKDERTEDQKAKDYAEAMEKGEVNPLKEDGYI